MTIVENKKRGAPIRALLIGSILITVNCYWNIMANVWSSAAVGGISIYYNAIFSLLILILFKILLRRFAPRMALSQGELLIVYLMLTIASGLSGIFMMQILVPSIPHAFWYATPENEWKELFWRYLPRWLTISDKKVLTGFYNGESTLYTINHVRGWLGPVLWWTLFVFALLFVMMCINIIIRRQWTEKEKLSYPIIQLPLEMAGSKSNFFSNKIMWLGFFIGFAIDIVDGLHYLHPVIPSLGAVERGYDIGRFFTNPPWNAVGWTPVSIYPFAVGLSFLMPLDLAFSSFFFYMMWKALRVFGKIAGFQGLPSFPYADQQSFGVLIGICFSSFWLARKHLHAVFRKVLNTKSKMDDSNEPMRYRTTVIAFIFGIIFLMLFCYKAGMSVPISITFLALYFAISIAIARMRAEFTVISHDFHWIGPDGIMVSALGSRRIGAGNLTSLSMLYFLNHAQSSNPMPQQLEGFKMAERTKMSGSELIWAMSIATIVGTIASIWVLLHIIYKFGYEACGMGGVSWTAFNRLQKWLSQPQGTDYLALVFVIFGFIFAISLVIMRMRFFWWPLHPAPLAVSASYFMNIYWFSIFCGWFAKLIILRFGGLKTHRQSIPFFLGLILGELTAASFWNIMTIVAKKAMYMFVP